MKFVDKWANEVESGWHKWVDEDRLIDSAINVDELLKHSYTIPEILTKYIPRLNWIQNHDEFHCIVDYQPTWLLQYQCHNGDTSIVLLAVPAAPGLWRDRLYG